MKLEKITFDLLGWSNTWGKYPAVNALALGYEAVLLNPKRVVLGNLLKTVGQAETE
ncbi:MAG: hypothetical protein KME06_15835 [Kastovskya adunca ATA6-11-RM4]|nr:hypothetical protein [Kastovskya adunca ATA6-11-RM4]